MHRIKKAQGEYNEYLVVGANKSLNKLVQGYMAKEIRTITVDTGKRDKDDKPIVKKKTHRNRKVLPSKYSVCYIYADKPRP